MKYFSIEELCKSDTAKSLHINNTPSEEIKENLEALIIHVLDVLRESYGKPIRVNSGYRSAELNNAIKGAANSQHLTGEAADITAGSREENKKLFDLIMQNGVYDQLIDEMDYSWVHVSYKRNLRNRKQVLYIK